MDEKYTQICLENLRVAVTNLRLAHRDTVAKFSTGFEKNLEEEMGALGRHALPAQRGKMQKYLHRRRSLAKMRSSIRALCDLCRELH